MVGVPHPTRRKNEGKKLSRKYLELSERRGVFTRKKRRGKRAEKKSSHKKHKAARATSPLEELTFGTLNVRTAAVNGVNGMGHIDTLLRTGATKGCCVIKLQETKRDGTSEISALDTASFPAVIVAWLRAGKGSMARAGDKGGDR